MKEKFLNLYKKHKKKIFIAVLLLGIYIYWQSQQANSIAVTKYTLGAVEKGSIITSVSGTGQVSPSNQVEVKPKVSADIVAVKVKAGQKVKKGDLLIQLDDKDLKLEANKARDNLSIAQANLQVKVAGATAEEIALAKNSVDAAKAAYEIATKNLVSTQKSAQESLVKAQLSLTNAENQYNNTLSTQDINSTTDSLAQVSAYKSALVSINSAYITMRTGLTFADSILNTSGGLKNVLGVLNSSTLNDANNKYDLAEAELKSFEVIFNSLGNNPSHVLVDEALSKEIMLAQTMRQLQHLTYQTLLSSITSSDLSQASLDSYRSSAASQESSMNSIISTLQNAEQAIANAKLGIDSGGLSTTNSVSSASNNLESARSSFNQAKLDVQKSLESAKNDLESKKLSLTNAQIQFNQKTAAPRNVDLLSLRVQVSQANTNYQQALDNLASSKVVSPLDGTVAQVSANVGDQAALATALVTVVTEKQLAVVSFNEVDAAKIAVGQVSTLTFSALNDLAVTGEVSSVDLIGVTTQGVVSYSVQIAFDSQNKQIKPQMSVTASIITNKKLDTLTLPNSAIKTDSAGANFVEVFEDIGGLVKGADGTYTANAIPRQKELVVGLVNDTFTEILSGLSEGDQVVIKTSTSGASAKTSTQQSGLGILGGGTRTGGMPR